MFKYALAVAVMAIVSQPSFAQDAMQSGDAMKSGTAMMKCDDASMMKLQADIDAMNDPMMKSQKDMAMKEMDMAKTSMKAMKADDCAMHMDSAIKAMKKS
jgi:hypothetical protein